MRSRASFECPVIVPGCVVSGRWSIPAVGTIQESNPVNTKILAAAAALIGAGVVMSQPAQAVTISKALFSDPSTACQLSIPTTDTAVRPKATGFRNEGSNAFVICGTSMFSNGGVPTSLLIQLTAFDGLSHSVSCTAVSRDSSGVGAVFSVKSTDVASATSISWSAADFGGTFVGFANSVTCTLPSGAAITGIRLGFADDVGA